MKHRVRIQLITLVGLLALVLSFSATAQTPLGSSEQFKIDQVHRSLDNVDKDLERIATAGRADAAGMALKGARRNLDQARDRLEQFLSRNQDLMSHPDVEAASNRLDQLAAAVEQSVNQPVNHKSAGEPARQATGRCRINAVGLDRLIQIEVAGCRAGRTSRRVAGARVIKRVVKRFIKQ